MARPAGGMAPPPGPQGEQGPPGPDSYTGGNASHWQDPPPVTMTEAVDRLAAYANQAGLLGLLGVDKP